MEYIGDILCMKSDKDNYTFSEKNKVFDMIITSEIGDREEQQDASGFIVEDNRGIVTICDGMGGHDCGKLASNLAVNEFLEEYDNFNNYHSAKDFYCSTAESANAKISNLKDAFGKKLMAGTTIVSVFINEHSLYWLSIGDSRIYLYRNGDFVQINTDHNLKTLLEKQFSVDEITKDEYNAQIVNGNTLVSFLGMGELKYIDSNESDFKLNSGDIVMLTTDGLYKMLTDNTIKEVLDNFPDVRDIAHVLSIKANKFSKKNAMQMDNTTFAIIKIM